MTPRSLPVPAPGTDEWLEVRDPVGALEEIEAHLRRAGFFASHPGPAAGLSRASRRLPEDASG